MDDKSASNQFPEQGAPEGIAERALSSFLSRRGGRRIEPWSHKETDRRERVKTPLLKNKNEH